MRQYIESRRAAADVEPHRIAAYDDSEGEFTQAAGPSASPLMGITGSLGAVAGTVCDVIRSGPTELEYGGAVGFGDPLTADIAGRAVVAQPGEAYIARADEAGDAGTIGRVFIERGTVPAAVAP
ncbi:hypothetical protein FBY06_1405 [Pseudomonas sp. SJZ085]|uniref:DUF2190 domain-containing protein n=1 Tax=unclassified Pseudomonas TaxID=196821 RepID=UPI00119C35C3|nr:MULTISPECIES: DUF2190 domain-containing protein [unclassified Pseudomonas]TWC12001.1 hypothetical protein FBX99_1395 [Pseudomonas sp. SJZ074]TWC30582.1 hypothetical protein FBY06_1405 [Pseudomonas sp. SJZ085]